MHPLFGHGGRLLIYLLAWVPIGVLLAAVLAGPGGDWLTAFALALPLALFYAFVCLAAWFPSRAFPLRRAFMGQAIANHLLAAALSTSLWQLVGSGWAQLLSGSGRLPGAVALFDRQVLIVVTLGVLLYTLAAASSYLYLAARDTLAAERNAVDAEQRRQLADQELALARALQHRLLPEPRFEGDRLRLAARNLAARGVAGDFYDYHDLEDGQLRLAVADVAGKGMAASLIMATVKAILPMIGADRSLVDTLGELNRRLAGGLEKREFVALALAQFEPDTGRVELVNAGLPDAYVLRRGGGVETVAVPQPRLPLGIRAEVGYHSVELALEPGDRLLLLTDGLPEAPVAEGEPLGYERLEALFDHHCAAPGAWLDRLLERLQVEAAATQDDDWTALLLERSAA